MNTKTLAQNKVSPAPDTHIMIGDLFKTVKAIIRSRENTATNSNSPMHTPTPPHPTHTHHKQFDNVTPPETLRLN